MEKIYNEQSRKSGVYKLTNKLNGRFYIGSCKEFKERWKAHERQLLNNKHSNKFLQADFNKCGSDVFIFEVIEVIDGHQKFRLNAEQLLLDQYFDNADKCYNLRSIVSPINSEKAPWNKGKKCLQISGENHHMFGKHHSEESRKKMSEANKGRIPWNKGKKASEETRKKISESGKGRSPPQKDKTYEEFYGETRAKELKQNHSKAMKGQPSTNKGKKTSVETRKKQSLAKKGKYIGKKHPMYGKHHSEKSKKKMALAKLGNTGMKCPNAKIYDHIQLCSPDGIVYTRIECLAEFCRIHGLSAKAMCSLLKRRFKNYKKWKLI